MTHRSISAKGARYERSICGRLSVWVSGGTRKDVFWRSAMSGGRASVMLINDKQGHKYSAQSGDISAVHESGAALLYAFVIECKHWRDIKLMQAVCGRKSGLPAIWKKLMKECKGAEGRLPMLVARQNRMPDLLMTNKAGYRILRAGCSSLRIRLRLPMLDLYGFLLRDVLTDIDFKDISKLCRKHNKCRDSFSLLTSTSRHARATSTDGKSSSTSKRKRKIERLRLPSSLAT